MSSAPWRTILMGSPGAPPRLTPGVSTSAARVSGATAQTTALPSTMTRVTKLMQDAVTSVLTGVLIVTADLTYSGPG